MKYSFIFLITLIFSCNIINDKSINQINSDELLEFIQINDAILVDVRTEDEYNTGYIENSINIDYLSDIFDYNDFMEKNSFSFNFYGIWDLISKYFQYGGAYVDDKITDTKMKIFLEKYSDDFRPASNEYVKIIHNASD